MFQNIHACSDIGFYHFDRDGASSNTFLVEHVLSNLPSHVLGSDWRCSLHNIHLVEVNMFSMFPGVLKSLYSCTLFLRMGGNVVRLGALQRASEVQGEV